MKQTLENIPHLIWNGHDESVLCNDHLSDDLNIVSALKFTLDYINRPVSKIEVAGLTGAAFYTGWNAEHLLSGLGGTVMARRDAHHIPQDDLPIRLSYLYPRQALPGLGANPRGI